MDELRLQLLREMLDRHAPALVLFARGLCDSPDDVVQDCLLRLVAGPTLPERPVAWLFQCTRRRALSARRSAIRRRRHELAAGQREPWFVPATDVALDARRATEALDELPSDLREVIVARVWGGLSFAEIGQLLDCSDSAAHRRLIKGLTLLREKLGVACQNSDSTPT